MAPEKAPGSASSRRSAADPSSGVDVVDRVEKLDETGIPLVQRVAGAVIFQLEHTWSAGEDGAHYVSVMDIAPGRR